MKLASMNISGDMGSKNFIIPTIILAYESKVKRATLEKWMETNGNTVACCIFNKETLLKEEGINVFENTAYGIKHHGVLAFVATFHKMLTYLINERDFQPNLDIYLTGRPAATSRKNGDRSIKN